MSKIENQWMNMEKRYSVDRSQETFTIKEIREANGDTLTEEEYSQIEDLEVGEVWSCGIHATEIERVQ